MFAKIPLVRRFIYSVSTISFVISSVVLVFFALGYRFNRQTGIWIHSGTVTLKSNPKKVDIALNGKPIDKKSYDIINDSYNLNGIKPGTYRLAITSPGFSSWEKEIQVHSGLATEFWNIVLTEEVPSTKKVLDISAPEFYQLFNGGEEIIYASRAEGFLKIFIYSQKTGSSIKVVEEPKNRKEALSLKAVSFSPDHKNAILKIQEGKNLFFYLVLLEDLKKNGPNEQNFIYLNKDYFAGGVTTDESTLTTPEITGQSPEDPLLPTKTAAAVKKIQTKEAAETTLFTPNNFQWLSSERFFFVSANNLYSVDIKEKKAQKILEGVKGYEVSQNKLFYIKTPSNLIFKASLEGAEITQISENMIDQDLDVNDLTYQLSVYDDKRIALLNSNKELYLFNENEKEHQTFKQLSGNCKGMHFSNDGKKILYYSSDQIKVYYLREWEVQPKNDVGANVLIYENQKQPIENAVWHQNYQHIIFSEPNTISLVEIDTRNKINKSLIVQSKVTETYFTWHMDTEALYFLDLTERGAYLNQLVLPER